MMSYREEKGRNKLAQLEKLGIELKPLEGGGDLMTSGGMQSEQNYYNPLATATQGKYAEQIQKRKLLWANKVTIINSGNDIVKQHSQYIISFYNTFFCSQNKMMVKVHRAQVPPPILGWAQLSHTIRMGRCLPNSND